MQTKTKTFMIFRISLLVFAVIGSTFAYYVWRTSSDQETKIVTNIGAATVYFNGGASIENAKLRPVSDKSKGIVKTIEARANTSGVAINMYLDIISIDDGLKHESFKYEFYKGGTLLKSGNFTADSLTNNTVDCTTNSTKHIVLTENNTVATFLTSYKLYIWIDGANYENPITMMNKNFSFKLHADGTGGFIKEGKIPDTPDTDNTLASNIVTTYINAPNKTDVVNQLKYYYDTEHSLMSDADGNVRYYGASPNNYIYFNCSDYSNQSSSTCETWRIIGVFNNKVKLIRGGQIGTYSWDNKNTSTGAETNDGKNDWTDARLMKLLNPGYERETTGGSLYYNAKSGNCYAGQNNATKACDFTSIGIKNDKTRGLISEETYSLLGWKTSDVYTNEIYEYERSTGKVYSGRTTTWTGKIALPYPSDYGYAVDLSKCGQNLHNYDNNTCTSNNWMKEILGTSDYGWLLTSISGNANNAWLVYSTGLVGYYYAYRAFGVTPVLYLNSELSVKAGTGSSSAPYQLSA